MSWRVGAEIAILGMRLSCWFPTGGKLPLIRLVQQTVASLQRVRETLAAPDARVSHAKAR